MRILLVSSAFSGLTQRFYTELMDAGYSVSVELHSGDMGQLMEGVELFKPDLILCPFLTKRLPASIYQTYKCLIVHPGIKGDRGPSSLDWAIQTGQTEWGVTLLEADEEMDAGPVWASKNFPLRAATKSNVFYRDVTQAAVDCLWEALSFFAAPAFKPEIQDYNRPDYKGSTLPTMKQTDRAIDWKKHKTDDILRRIWAADGTPGVLDEIYGIPVFLHNAHKATNLSGKPGDIIAIANSAICRATVDGAIWIGHLKQKFEDGKKGIKLPAAHILKDVLPKTVPNNSALKTWFGKSAIKKIDINYQQPGRQLPCQEVWYEQEDDIGYVHFHFHNGAMGTEQCRLLLAVYRHVATLPVRAIVLMGGEASFSNGIHLNHIEAADDPAHESWLNINAIDDLVYQIVTTMDKVTIAALSGSAGAGGAIMPLAADKVFARDGVIFNAHYKNMGELYGSEYWTYLLPKRVGKEMALNLTEQRLPISAKKAWQINLIDKVLDKNHDLFVAQVKHWMAALVNDNDAMTKCLADKARARCQDEATKAIAIYRQMELVHMYQNFYGNDLYHKARYRFVYKICEKCTPANLAMHRNSKVCKPIKLVDEERKIYVV
jgi:putative two-component system protein, hydrogenase maturation factor HypX/HoxX